MKLTLDRQVCYMDSAIRFNFRFKYFVRNFPAAAFICILVFLICTFVQAQTDSNYYKQGLDNLNRQDFAAAVLSFQSALKVSPEDDKARQGLAIALIGVEKFQEASRHIAKLLLRAPKDPNLLEMAAQSFWQQKRFVEAETVLRRRLSLGNERAELQALFGDVLDAQKKTAEAAVAYEKAVKLIPDSIDLRYALGALYWKLIRYEDAEREFLEILRRQPNEPRASFNLGDIYLTNGNAAKAMPFLEIAVKSFPEEFDAHFALGRALLATGKLERAITELNTATKMRPEVAEGYYQLGLALQRSGRREEAKPIFKKAQDLQNAKRNSEAPTNKQN